MVIICVPFPRLLCSVLVLIPFDFCWEFLNSVSVHAALCQQLLFIQCAFLYNNREKGYRQKYLNDFKIIVFKVFLEMNKN